MNRPYGAGLGVYLDPPVFLIQIYARPAFRFGLAGILPGRYIYTVCSLRAYSQGAQVNNSLLLRIIYIRTYYIQLYPVTSSYTQLHLVISSSTQVFSNSWSGAGIVYVEIRHHARKWLKSAAVMRRCCHEARVGAKPKHFRRQRLQRNAPRGATGPSPADIPDHLNGQMGREITNLPVIPGAGAPKHRVQIS